jgi:hypothetical protein
MSNKTKYYVIGTLAAAIGGFFIQGVSDTGVAYTGSKEGFRSDHTKTLVVFPRWHLATRFILTVVKSK